MVKDVGAVKAILSQKCSSHYLRFMWEVNYVGRNYAMSVSSTESGATFEEWY
jgi:hypothetical protein